MKIPPDTKELTAEALLLISKQIIVVVRYQNYRIYDYFIEYSSLIYKQVHQLIYYLILYT